MFKIAWNKKSEFIPHIAPHNPITVLVPFRNEQENLEALCQALIQQTLSSKLYEVIFIDDHSTDDSRRIVEETILQLDNFRLISARGEGKKKAIEKGVEKAKFSFIVSIDADCYPGKEWLEIIGSYLSSSNTDLLIGLVSFNFYKRWFKQFQFFEFASLVFSGAGAAALNKPIMCNGANLVFSKELYLKAKTSVNNGFASGDDIFLLQYAKLNGYKIDVLKSRKSVVYTNPLENVTSFFHQRVRWASKSKGYTDKYTLQIAWLVMLSSVIQFLWPISFFLNVEFGLCLSTLILAKFIFDYSLIASGSSFLGYRISIIQAISFFIVYPFYIISVVSYALGGNVNWKGRKV